LNTYIFSKMFTTFLKYGDGKCHFLSYFFRFLSKKNWSIEPEKDSDEIGIELLWQLIHAILPGVIYSGVLMSCIRRVPVFDDEVLNCPLINRRTSFIELYTTATGVHTFAGITGSKALLGLRGDWIHWYIKNTATVKTRRS